MKIAIAQLNPTVGDLAGNAQRILTAAQQAAAQGARLVLTPELSLCGYPPRDLLLQPSFIQAAAETLMQLAHDLPPQVAVLVGTVEANSLSSHRGGKPLFNSTALLEGGEVRQIFHKRLLPTYDVFDEERYFEPGQESNSFTLDSCKIGVTICEDLWNDEEFWGRRTYSNNPIADLARQGVDLIVNLSASPYSVGKQKLREAMLQHAAVRYHQPIIYTNQVGGNDDLLFDGSSVAFNRQGELIYRSPAFATDLAIVELDLTAQDFVSSPKQIFPAPESADAEIWAALVLGVRDYTRKCGFSKVVIGLSGGIDSSLVAAIATAALGRQNVLGVLMPSPYTSEDSIQDALELAKNLGIQTQTLPIGQLMQDYDATFKDWFAGLEPDITEENIQSRIRGNLLMAVSNKFGHLLISTGNKSEMAVGYCTLYGDMNGGLAAIADVPKTRVYSICRWLNQTMQPQENPPQSFSLYASFWLPTLSCPVIPLNVLTKAPSAELKPGQTDQDSLPPYEILDDILDRLILQHQSLAEMVAAGHDPVVVEKVVKLVSRAEFKRRQAPPGLKVTDRAFGTGWRMPIASRWIAKTNAHPVHSPDALPKVALSAEP
jgi:NAD+ synthase (glutamine-hydrolysing)